MKILSVLVSILLMLQIGVPIASAIGTSAQSAILVDLESGQELYKQDIHTKRKIASTTKIMTAILAIESGKMDEYVTVTPEMVATEGSAIYLKVGDKVKLSDLVYGLMLRSGNDAALAIAVYVGGSVEGFVYQMNQTAELIGMENTHFTNPHGLDDGDNHYSTASDMAKLIEYAMRDKTFRKISGSKVHEATYSDGTRQIWGNKNKLVNGLYENSTGGKTGFTKKAGRILVSTAEKDGMNLAVVTINDPDDWNDHINLFEYGFNNYTKEVFLHKGRLPEIKEPFYKNNLHIKSDLHYLIENGTESDFELNYVLKDPKSFSKNENLDGQIVGKAELILGKKIVAMEPIYYGTDAKETILDVWKNIFTKTFSW